MGLSVTPSAATKDLGAMLSASNIAAADRTQASSSGTDTFGDLLSNRVAQDAACRHAGVQSVVDDAGHHADIARKDVTRTSTAGNDQDAKPIDGNTLVPNITTPAANTIDTATAKQSQPTSIKDLDAATEQAVVNPTARLAAQIEAARQAAQQVAAAQLLVTLPAASSASNIDTDATSSAASKLPTNGAATLAAASAAVNGAQDFADSATVAQAGLTGLSAMKDAKVSAASTPTPPATALSDSGMLAQAVAHTRAAADNTPTAVCQLGSASSGQGANADRGLPRRDLSLRNTPAQPVAAAVVNAISHASNGGNTDNADNASTQSNVQGNDIQFQDVLSRTAGDGRVAAPISAVDGADAGAAAGTLITPQQVHTLPTLSDAAWPQSVTSQLAFMQVHRQSSAKLQLDPTELGDMHVRLRVGNSTVNASFAYQHQAVAEFVQDVMPRLCDAMQQGGMQPAQAPVSTGDFSQQRSTSQGSSAQNQGSGSDNGGSGSRYGSNGSQNRPDMVTTAPCRVSNREGAIDIFA